MARRRKTWAERENMKRLLAHGFISLLLILAQDPRSTFHSQNRTGGGGTPGISGTFHAAPGSGCVNGGLSCTSAGFAVTVGDLILCFVSTTTTTSNTLSCTDADEDTFNSYVGPITFSTNTIGQLFIAVAGHTNAAETVTPTVTNSANHMSGCMMSITISGGTAAIDKTTSSNFTATTALTTGSTGTLTSSNEVAFVGFALANTAQQTGVPTAGTGWLNANYSSDGNINNSDAFCEWQSVSANTALTGTATATANETGSGLIATFN
jgi:hypothetical protein